MGAPASNKLPTREPPDAGTVANRSDSNSKSDGQERGGSRLRCPYAAGELCPVIPTRWWIEAIEWRRKMKGRPFTNADVEAFLKEFTSMD